VLTWVATHPLITVGFFPPPLDSSNDLWPFNGSKREWESNLLEKASPMEHLQVNDHPDRTRPDQIEPQLDLSADDLPQLDRPELEHLRQRVASSRGPPTSALTRTLVYVPDGRGENGIGNLHTYVLLALVSVPLVLLVSPDHRSSSSKHKCRSFRPRFQHFHT
jgi:hypothetical protein